MRVLFALLLGSLLSGAALAQVPETLVAGPPSVVLTEFPHDSAGLPHTLPTPVEIPPIVDPEHVRVVARFEFTGNFYVLVDNERVEEILFGMVRLLHPSVPIESFGTRKPHVRTEGWTADIICLGTCQRLGRYTVRQRAKTYACRLSVYE